MTVVALMLSVEIAVLLVDDDEDVIEDENAVEGSELGLSETKVELGLGVVTALLTVGGESVEDGEELELSVRTVELRLWVVNVVLPGEDAEAELPMLAAVLGICVEAALLLAEADVVGDVAPAHIASRMPAPSRPALSSSSVSRVWQMRAWEAGSVPL